jgi:hypothetical protein
LGLDSFEAGSEKNIFFRVRAISHQVVKLKETKADYAFLTLGLKNGLTRAG